MRTHEEKQVLFKFRKKQITILAHFWCGTEGKLMVERRFFPTSLTCTIGYTLCQWGVDPLTSLSLNRTQSNCPLLLHVTSYLPTFQRAINTLRTGSFKLFKRPFLGFLTILTL